MTGIHPGSKETHDYIAKWIAPDFFYSVNDVWHRFGMLGVFGDYVISSLPLGDIAEIGVGESSIYLTHLARKYNRRSYHCDVAPGKILNPLTVAGYLTERAINIEMNSGCFLEEKKGIFYCGPSDDFFKDVKISPLAIAFIDGDHVYEQAKKDFFNFLPLMLDNGFIFLHDTYPPDEDHLSEHRCGGVYKLRQELEKDPRFDCMTLTRGCAMGVGLTIVRVKPLERAFYND